MSVVRVSQWADESTILLLIRVGIFSFALRSVYGTMYLKSVVMDTSWVGHIVLRSRQNCASENGILCGRLEKRKMRNAICRVIAEYTSEATVTNGCAWFSSSVGECF